MWVRSSLSPRVLRPVWPGPLCKAWRKRMEVKEYIGALISQTREHVATLDRLIQGK